MIKNAVVPGAINDSRWMTIDSAPKSGELILACDKHHGYLSVVRKNFDEWEVMNFDGESCNMGFYPTHWMPIPPKPWNY